jgi:cbb3-type cytochrome oxidase subunit 1
MAQEAAKAYWRLTVLWLIVSCGLGVLCAFALFDPHLLDAHPLFGYGRLVAAHRTAVIYGFLFNAVFAAGYTLIPRFTDPPDRVYPISTFLALFGSLVTLTGLFFILDGHASGQEYADMPLSISLVFWGFLIAVAVDLGMTVAGGRVLRPHPSFGLLFPAVLLPAVILPFALPGWWGSGVFAALRAWISIRALFFLSFLFAALATALAVSGTRTRPVRLSRGIYTIAIALIAATGPFLGIVHLLDAPIPSGLKALGAFAGVAAATGIFLVARLLYDGKTAGPSRFLITTGLGWLVVASIQGILMVLPPVHSALHFTLNTSAHAHLALGGIGALFLAGALVSWSNSKSSIGLLGAWLFAAGITGVFLFQGAAGVVQAVAGSRALGYPDWVDTFKWLQIGVGFSGLAALVGCVVLGGVVVQNLRSEASMHVQVMAASGEGGTDNEP